MNLKNLIFKNLTKYLISKFCNTVNLVIFFIETVYN